MAPAKATKETITSFKRPRMGLAAAVAPMEPLGNLGLTGKMVRPSMAEAEAEAVVGMAEEAEVPEAAEGMEPLVGLELLVVVLEPEAAAAQAGIVLMSVVLAELGLDLIRALAAPQGLQLVVVMESGELAAEMMETLVLQASEVLRLGKLT